jgi:hypothetical protein
MSMLLRHERLEAGKTLRLLACYPVTRALNVGTLSCDSSNRATALLARLKGLSGQNTSCCNFPYGPEGWRSKSVLDHHRTRISKRLIKDRGAAKKNLVASVRINHHSYVESELQTSDNLMKGYTAEVIERAGIVPAREFDISTILEAGFGHLGM